jgi:ribulose-phosphate 3-epimerase
MLSANPTKLGEELVALEKAGADAIHWDIMDGVFVDAITFGSHVIAGHRPLTRLQFDVHLMMENPDKHLVSFYRAGADIIIVHTEACAHLHQTLSQIKSLGIKSGLALNPATSIHAIEYCIDVMDMVLVMGVNPGSSGQNFIESQLQKISNLRKILPPTIEVCVDGGIIPRTAFQCCQHGANSLVSGTYIFRNPDYAAAIQELKGN